MTDDVSLLARVERLEAHLGIQQIVSRYAMALDARDLDGLVSLFTDDVGCGRWGTGRDALRRFFDTVLRRFYRSQHLVCGHVIDLIDADHASGRVYCRAEHEDRGQWITMAICYFDSYERRQGQWQFVRRKEREWYAADVLARPGGPEFCQWPGRPEKHATLPHAFPTWEAFWRTSDPQEIASLTKHP